MLFDLFQDLHWTLFASDSLKDLVRVGAIEVSNQLVHADADGVPQPIEMINVDDVIDVLGELLILLLETIHLASEFQDFLVDYVGASGDILVALGRLILINTARPLRKRRVMSILFNIGLASGLVLGLAEWLLDGSEIHFGGSVLVVGVGGGYAHYGLGDRAQGEGGLGVIQASLAVRNGPIFN